MDLTNSTYMSVVKLSFYKIKYFSTTLDENGFYMKILVLDEIYIFLVLWFSV